MSFIPVHLLNTNAAGESGNITVIPLFFGVWQLRKSYRGVYNPAD